MTTTNMGLTLPFPTIDTDAKAAKLGDTLQPAGLLAIAMLLVDLHDHTTGKGVQIPTAGIADAAITAAKLASGVVAASGTQELSTPGTVDLTKRTIRLSSNGTLDAITLGDGTVGQRLSFVHSAPNVSCRITAGGSIHLADGISTITFTTGRASIELEWKAAGWFIVAMGGVAATLT